MVVGDEGSFGGCSDEPVVPDVGDDQVPGADQVFVLAEEFLGDFAFPNFGVRESPDDGHSIGCAEQREAESPEVAGVGGAVSVAGVPCQLGAFHGLAGFPAGNRVESRRAVVWAQDGESRASSVITADSSPVAWRTRWPHPDCCGKFGNMSLSCAWAERIHFRSDAIPRSCWATTRQSNSISVRTGLRPGCPSLENPSAGMTRSSRWT